MIDLNDDRGAILALGEFAVCTVPIQREAKLEDLFSSKIKGFETKL